jgi:porphobilinogen synthase
LRRLTAETKLNAGNFIYPLFIIKGKARKQPIKSMPGIFRFSPDLTAVEAENAFNLKIPGLLLFGIPDKKDAIATSAYAEDGVVQKAVRVIKERVPEMVVITDVCLCEYTDHGHCGIIKDGEVDNDATLPILVRQALSHLRAGADMVAPSDMMDGRVGAIRKGMEEAGFGDRAIMAYSAKYASAFYGPFREAADSAPKFGNRRGYQMNPANVREALREVKLDLEEGADIIMVKPALSYLDVIRRVKEAIDAPLAAYNVSGEYSMVKAAVDAGWIDEKQIIMEILTSIKRAGADIIITYHALEAAKWLSEE